MNIIKKILISNFIAWQLFLMFFVWESYQRFDTLAWAATKEAITIKKIIDVMDPMCRKANYDSDCPGSSCPDYSLSEGGE